jgi:XTP/dITP diphosphohydrolase
MRDEAATALRALYETVERLRAPGGCPWDREQTHRSLRPYLLEETYEALEAIETDHQATLREELGDLLLQVFMHAAIAQEARGDGADGAERPAGEDEAAGFDIGDIAETTRAKMIHRHPHVFADVQVAGAADVVVNWERLKALEKGGRLSLLDGVPGSLPALAYAQGVQKRPARIGFDETPATADAVTALRSAVDAVIAAAAHAPAPTRGADWSQDSSAPAATASAASDEVAAAASPGNDHAAPPPPAPAVLEDALGDLLFAAVALARRLRVNPEDALRRRARSFADRFRALERVARAEGRDLHDLDDAEWQRRWEDAGAEPSRPG